MMRMGRRLPRRWTTWLLIVVLLALGVEAWGLVQDSWRPVPIPQTWKDAPGGPYGRREGSFWYRCLVQIPAEWRDRDVQLFVESVDDARQIFVNGRQVGQLGQFPPDYQSGLGQTDRFPVPRESLQFGETNLVAIRVYQNDGRAGFNVAAPVFFAGDEAIRLAGDWEVRDGDQADWARDTAIADAGRITFEQREDAGHVTATLRKLAGEDGPLAPQASLARMVTADDLKVELCLSDPDIGQPLSIKFDERGRLWLLQYLQYPDPAGLKVVSRDKFLRTVYDKVPEPPPHHVPGRDRISIHEDTDGDGVYDKHKNFVDNLNLATSFAHGRGGVWVLNPPYLLFYADRNGDDVPDGDPEVHLEGFGLEDSHSITNSLRWGPDGWLYASQGSTVTGNVRQYGSNDPVVFSMGQLIWRYHPESRRYEIFAEGGGNAFGVEIDDKGRIYSGHNGGDTRGFHYVQGGYYQKGFGKHGSLSNPYAFGYFPAMRHHSVPRFTHTFVIYQADTLPPAYQGKLFGVGPLQSHVVYSDVQPYRSTFATEDLGHPLTSSDSWFRPVDIKLGPDGGLYVADFYEQRIDHASHYQGRVDRSSGRVYRLTAADAARPAPFNLAALDGPRLLTYLEHPNRWYRQTALRLLADRRDSSLIDPLKKRLQENVGQTALEALWALNLSGGFTPEIAQQLLQHPDPYVQLWTIRLLGDQGEISDSLAKALADRARTADSVEVRVQLACTARRLSWPLAEPIISHLIARGEDADDPFQPLLLWWAIEAKAGDHTDQILQWLGEHIFLWDEPLFRNELAARLMRRYAQSGTQKDLLVCARLFQIAPDQDLARRMLTGFEEAFEGRSLAGMPDELLTAIANVGGLSLVLRLRQGQSDAVREALDAVVDEQKPEAERAQLIEIFSQVQQSECIPVLLQVFEKSASVKLRALALTTLQAYADTELGGRVLEHLAGQPDDVRNAGFAMLACRAEWSEQLLTAVDQGRVDQQTVPITAVRRILLHDRPEIEQLVRKHWGEVDGATTEQMQAQITRLTQLILQGAGNPYKGKTLFMEHCGKCHTLYEDGGQVGPNLTSYKRDDLGRMLLNIVNPNIEIREGFENYIVITDDGRALSGFIDDQDNRIVVLKTAEGQRLVIEREQIDEMAATARSVMPDGLLDKLGDQEVRDLFAYLRSTQPLP